MDTGKIQELTKGAQAEFERRVAASGLEIAQPVRGGYLVTCWGNEGRDIEGALNREQLEYYPTGRGAYVVSSGPLVRAALQVLGY